MITVEICLTGIESALAAQAGWAHRIELCENLADGGTTPSFGMMALVREKLDIAVNVMIRPRGGDFCYSDAEFAVMRRNVQAAKQVGVDGVVFGILKPDGTIDMERCKLLVEEIRPLSITFHRAFDMTRDPFAALDNLLELGVDRLLTSGQQPTAMQGQDLICQLQKRAGNRIAIMAGSGINHDNAAKLITATGVREIHVGSCCTEHVPSRMAFKNPHIAMSHDDLSEYATLQVTEQRVQAFMDVVSLV